ncbi:MAG: hypothetical protein ACPGYX_05040 [Oceanobacter sp.]
MNNEISLNGKRVLLLQGPVGDFFQQLQVALQASGAEVDCVSFNGADKFLGPKAHRYDFYGDLAEWREWLAEYCRVAQPGAVILFGSERPAHKVAREMASSLNLDVWCLEEGYVRPGFITMEKDGNNAGSPMCSAFPDAEWQPDPSVDFHEARDFKGFKAYSLKSAIYYITRTLTTFGRRKSLYHKRFTPHVEVFHWARNVARRWRYAQKNLSVIQTLLEHYDGRFYIVPMQIARDCNMGDAAMGWDSARLIRESLKSFAEAAPVGTRLVFKVHPLDRGHSNWEPYVNEHARHLGIADRVDVIDTGSLGLLTRHSAGMITVTSTSGLSAIHHGVPLLVVGKAVYAHPELAMCGEGEPDFNRFWSEGFVAPEGVRRRFECWMKEMSLVPGDFYAEEGIEVACRSVIQRLLRHEGAVIKPKMVETSDQEGSALTLLTTTTGKSSDTYELPSGSVSLATPRAGKRGLRSLLVGRREYPHRKIA